MAAQNEAAPQERGAENELNSIMKVACADFGDREPPFTISYQQEHNP